MKYARRQFLKSSSQTLLLGLLAAAGLVPGVSRSAQWNEAAFSSKSVEEALEALGGNAPQQSDGVILDGPEIAENGAVVPLEISSNLDKPS